MMSPFGSDIANTQYDLCVAGAGPSGIALALEAARLGRRVLLLESGKTAPNPEAQTLADAEIVHPNWHVPMAIGVQRRLGGAGNLWGGRCVAYDELDFTVRPAVPLSGWPITQADLRPFARSGCFYADIGEPVFIRPIEGLAIADPDFSADHLERWSREPRPQIAHAKALASDPRVDLRLSATLAGLDFGPDGAVTAARVQAPDGTRATVRASHFVLACGGVENARLLLNAQADPAQNAPNRFGGEAGMLGRFYMGHLLGIISEIVIAGDTLDAALDYLATDEGVYVRRRFTPSAELQARERLLNVAIWTDFPPIHHPRHRNGVLSAAYLGLSIGPLGRALVAESIRRTYVGAGKIDLPGHLANILRDLPNTLAFIPAFLYRRKIARPRQPGFFQRNPARRYALRYHAETRPDPANRITLGDATDAVGLRRAVIDFSFRHADAHDLLRAHDLFSAWLSRTGLGQLEFNHPPGERVDAILAQANDGHHQIGTTRMADSPTFGVVDLNCRVFQSPNLHIAGASVLPTSSQANPTLTAITLAVRLASHLCA